MILIRSCLFGFAYWMIVCCALSQQLADDEKLLRDRQEIQRKKQAAFQQLYKNLPKLDLCGRVVDQYGAPVVGATVTIEWKNADEFLDKFSEMQTDTVKTDEQGNFKLRCNKPLHAWASAEKEGYAPLSGEVGDLVRLRNLMPEAVPAVITLRKRGEPSFLLRKTRTRGAWVWMYTNKTGKVTADLLAGIADGQRPLRRFEDVSADISYDGVNKSWVVDYTVAQGDGVICSDDCLYEAPSSGYTNKVILKISEATEKYMKYLYLRTRSPAIYSRIEMNHDVSNDSAQGPFLRIFREEIRVNPYGERNLEYDERFDKGWRAREEMTKEAVTAISQGRFPEKCKDVPARIKAANERK